MRSTSSRQLLFDLPERALAIRQPWAWAVIHGGKDIENRFWGPRHPARHFRGDVCIHASKSMAQNQYRWARWWMKTHIGIKVPLPEELQYGGIIGTATVVDMVPAHESPWMFELQEPDPRHVGIVLANPQAVPFHPMRGQLGFFRWEGL